MMEKTSINHVRSILKKVLKRNQEEIAFANSFLAKLSNSVALNVCDIEERSTCINELNREFDTDFPLLVSKEIVTQFLQDNIQKLEIESKQIQAFIKALSIQGMSGITYNFPNFIMLCSDYIDLQFLVISGIRYNGTHEKNNMELMTDFEIKLYQYEKELSGYINDDFSIDDEFVPDFLKLYQDYLQYYFIYRKVDFISTIRDILFDHRYSNSLNEMKRYIHSCNKKHSEKEEKDVIQKEVSRKVEIDPLKSYIADGKVVKLCDTITFTKLLENSNLPIHLQREYLQQMNNLFNRIHFEKLEEKKENLRNSILTEEELSFYQLAKVSGKVEATQIVKEIDAVIDLLLDVKSQEDREELIQECKLYVSYLSAIIVPTPTITEEQPKVLYYKYSLGDTSVPYILDGIIDAQKGTYKEIHMNLNKLLNGYTEKDREVQGVPIRCWAKGRDFKIFYTTVLDVTIIIHGIKGDNAYQIIQNVVNSKDFLNYLKDVDAKIKKNEIPNEATYTENIMEELTKSNAVRKRV